MSNPLKREGQEALYALNDQGFYVMRDVIPKTMIENVLREIHIDLFSRGFLPDEIENYKKNSNWFPWLRKMAPIFDLEEFLPSEIRSGELCEPQIVLQPPDNPVHPLPEISFHKDKEPEWAGGRKYSRIVGVALSRSSRADGGLLVRPFNKKYISSIELDVGDVVVMHPYLLHSSGINLSGSIRYALYFRYLEAGWIGQK